MKQERFKGFLLGKGLKLTKERELILAAVIETDGHFEPDGLFINLRRKGAKVSRASIYRMLPLLLEGGVIEEVERTDKHSHYELVDERTHHDHMICLRCGNVIEFYSSPLETLQDRLCRQERFKGVRHSLEIFGYCARCSE